MNMPTSALNVRESPEFPRRIGNGGIIFQTGRRNKAVSRMPIKMQYNLNLWPNHRNSFVIQEIRVEKLDGDSAMGQIPRSTERISSYY